MGPREGVQASGFFFCQVLDLPVDFLVFLDLLVTDSANSTAGQSCTTDLTHSV